MHTKTTRERDIFDACLRLPATRRGPFLDEACGDEPALKKRLERLLEAHDRAVSLDTGLARAVLVSDGVPSRIGPYRILREIGEGGMGVVYEAEQEIPVRRNVAVKLMKRGFDTKQAMARFESERQALALMSHPNIAGVHDAGATAQGRPYFAMELVVGESITTFCDRRRLTIAERLKLFVQVCAGVQHAHQKGIIHRDLKASNVLVANGDSDPVAKIIDFGIAKATSRKLTELTLATEFGQLIGTPEYMSPEQLLKSSSDVDTRSDIYALGVLLYELLVGALPSDANAFNSGFEALRKHVLEMEPRAPSVRLTTLGEASREVASKRSIDEDALGRRLRGDLDWIVMKALAKDPARRYAAASELAEDIARHLRHEAVQAGPPSRSYRVGKFVRRHRVGVTAAALVLATVVLGFAASTVALVRATRAERLAADEAAKAEAITGFLQDTLKSANPLSGQGPDVTVLQALDEAVVRLDGRFVDRPAIDAAVRATIGQTYLRLARYDEARPLLERSLETRRRVLGTDHEETARSMWLLGRLLTELGENDGAERLFRESLDAYRRLDSVETGSALLNVADVAEKRGDFEEAEAYLREAVRFWRSPAHRHEGGAAWALSNLGALLVRRGAFEEAESTLREALALQRALHGNDHALVGRVQHSLGNAISRRGSDGRDAGNCNRAIPSYREALRIFGAVYGPEHPFTSFVRSHYADCLIVIDRREEAEAALSAAHHAFLNGGALWEDEADDVGRALVDLYVDRGKNPKPAESASPSTGDGS